MAAWTLRLAVEQGVDVGDPAVDRTGAQGIEGLGDRHRTVLDHALRRPHLHQRTRQLMPESGDQAVARRTDARATTRATGTPHTMTTLRPGRGGGGTLWGSMSSRPIAGLRLQADVVS